MKKLMLFFVIGCLVVSGSVNAMDAENIFEAAINGDAELVEGFLLSGVPVDQSESIGYTPLLLATFSNHVPVIQLLAAWGADLNKRAQSGGFPLYWTMINASFPAAKALVAAGADVNQKHKDLTSAEWARSWLGLLSATQNDQLQSIIDLINRVNEATAVAKNQLLALMCAGHSRCGAASPARDVFHSYGNVANIMAQLIKKEAFEAALDSQNQ